MHFYVSDCGYLAIHPIEMKSQFKNSLHQFCKEIGVSSTRVFDPYGEQTSKEVRKFCNQVGTKLIVLEESNKWDNRAEVYIRILKEATRQDLRKSNSPMVLWDYGAERKALVQNITIRRLFQLDRKTPYEYLNGVPGDISNLCSFGCYEWCYYREEAAHLFPYQKEYLSRVL